MLPEKIIAGKSVRMSLAEDRTAEVWQTFMRDRVTIKDVKGADLYSIQVYDGMLDFADFNPRTEFTKWAGVEVESLDNIPNGLNVLILLEGLYAVFLHNGLASEFEGTFRYIFDEWLPSSGYVIDDRPHFEILGENYKNDDPLSEEEVWIPVIKRE